MQRPSALLTRVLTAHFALRILRYCALPALLAAPRRLGLITRRSNKLHFHLLIASNPQRRSPPLQQRHRVAACRRDVETPQRSYAPAKEVTGRAPPTRTATRLHQRTCCLNKISPNDAYISLSL